MSKTTSTLNEFFKEEFKELFKSNEGEFWPNYTESLLYKGLEHLNEKFKNTESFDKIKKHLLTVKTIMKNVAKERMKNNPKTGGGGDDEDNAPPPAPWWVDLGLIILFFIFGMLLFDEIETEIGARFVGNEVQNIVQDIYPERSPEWVRMIVERRIRELYGRLPLGWGWFGGGKHIKF